jgi:hypothetical protein
MVRKYRCTHNHYMAVGLDVGTTRFEGGSVGGNVT